MLNAVTFRWVCSWEALLLDVIFYYYNIARHHAATQVKRDRSYDKFTYTHTNIKQLKKIWKQKSTNKKVERTGVYGILANQHKKSDGATYQQKHYCKNKEQCLTTKLALSRALIKNVYVQFFALTFFASPFFPLVFRYFVVVVVWERHKRTFRMKQMSEFFIFLVFCMLSASNGEGKLRIMCNADLIAHIKMFFCFFVSVLFRLVVFCLRLLSRSSNREMHFIHSFHSFVWLSSEKWCSCSIRCSFQCNLI